MGSDSSSAWHKKADVVNETLGQYRRSGYVIHDHASTSQGLYMAVTTPDNVSLVLCYKIESRRTRDGVEFWRKGMSENMGPAMNDCPLRLLEYKSDYENHEWAKQWREGVRAYHAKRAALKARGDLTGQIVDVYGKRYKVLGKQKQSYIVELLATGQRFKMGRKVAEAAQVVAG